MKRAIRFKLIFVATAAMLGVTAWAQESLGDAAKKAQAHKKPAASKVYTNDDIPSVVIPASEKDSSVNARSAAEEKAGKAVAGDETSQKDQKSGDSKSEGLKKAVGDQKAKVADIEREVNLMEREHQVRVSAYYADAGNQLRDSKKWFEDEKKYQDDLAAKKKSLATAKDKLAELQESGRKAGVPAGQLE